MQCGTQIANRPVLLNQRLRFVALLILLGAATRAPAAAPALPTGERLVSDDRPNILRVAVVHAAVRQMLRAELDRWMIETDAPRAVDNDGRWDRDPYVGPPVKKP